MMKGYTLVKTANDQFTLVGGDVCKRVVEVYQSKRNENKFKVIESHHINGELQQETTVGGLSFVRCCLAPILGDNWHQDWHNEQVH